MSTRVDVVIAGAGIAGSSLACELADRASVVLLEREAQPGYHSTGRSAAMLTETYGSGVVRRLARASRPFFERPPSDFVERPLLSPRGMLHVARADQRGALDRAERAAAEVVPGVRRLDASGVRELAPLVSAGYVDGGLLEPEACAIDVALLHQGYLRGLRRRGGQLVGNAAITAITAVRGGWEVASAAGRWRAQVLVDAAGAWADQIAELAGVPPLGLVAKRRTAMLVDPPAGLDPTPWPMVIDVDERFYVKPEGRQLLVSPADETPVPPSDVQPEELDVALAVDRYETLTGERVPRIRHRWAGLRSFFADHDPVVGRDPAAPGFVWLAGQGGFGIMTAPALAAIGAALILGEEPPADLGPLRAQIGPERLRRG
ncbi:MAG TPA: FAD-binding oxidoreductase [Geminicoccaceae bacterium]|nr:FAD-binding oxidoreductase [Geminicoccaceae bacterium]